MSHETIYRSLFVQARGVLKKELLGHLRSKRTIRQIQKGEPVKALDWERSRIWYRSVSARPWSKIDAVPGHWEGDLIVPDRIRATLRLWWTRHTRYVMLVKVANRQTQSTGASCRSRAVQPGITRN